VDDFKRYEDELAERLKNLSVPDKKLAWEKMEKLLDNGDDNGGFMPPSSTHGNKRWGWWSFALLGLIGILWFIFHTSNKENIQGNKNTIVNSNVIQSNPSETNTNENVLVKNDPVQSENKNAVKPVKENNTAKETTKTSSDNIKGTNNVTGNNSTNDSKATGVNLLPKSTSGTGTTNTTATSRRTSPAKKSILHNKFKLKASSSQETSALTNRNEPETTTKNNKKNITYHLATARKKLRKKELTEKDISVSSTKKDIHLTKKRKYKSTIRHLGVEDETVEQDNVNKTTITIDSSRSVSLGKKTASIPADSILHKDSIGVKPIIKAAKDSSAAAKKKDEKNKKKKAYFAAGMGEQQSVSLNCNCAYPTSTNTNAGSIKNFIPAPYFRFYSVKKWFVQAAFKYAAAQHIGDFMYRSNLSGLIDTSYILRDVYYHQIPVSFNYTVLPNWSIGVGVIYNIYSSEVQQEDISKKIYGAPDSLISSTVIKDKKDSNSLSLSNYFQAMLETEYQWKHFSIGINCTMALQPFAKYSDPFSGSPATKNNNSVNVFVRYELWRSK
jgi:hypothetical protein